MTYNELKNTIDSVVANNAISNKSEEIIKYVKLMEDSDTKYEIVFLPITDGNGDKVGPSSLTVVGDDIKLADGIYFIYHDNFLVFTIDSSLVMYIARS